MPEPRYPGGLKLHYLRPDGDGGLQAVAVTPDGQTLWKPLEEHQVAEMVAVGAAWLRGRADRRRQAALSALETGRPAQRLPYAD